MAANIEKNDANVYENLQYAYDKVVFNPGNPPLHSELNVLQEYLELITQKSTAEYPSGWLSYRPFYTSKDLSNSFYTQNPTEPKPEVALVNGWPVYVTNTDTSLKHVNKINLNDFELRSGSRADGVFLEVWRSLLTPEDTNVLSKPQNISQISTIYGIDMYDESIGLAVGDKGTIIKTIDGGVTWVSKETPISIQFNRVKFYNETLCYAIGQKGYIIKSINGGDSWFALNSIVNDNLNDFFIIDQNTIIAVGDNGTILKTLDGTTFELIKSTSGTTENLNGIYFYDDRIGWIVGSSGTMLLTLDKGQSWQSLTIMDSVSNGILKTDLSSLTFFTLDDGIVVGKNGTIFKTADGGYHFVDISNRVWDGTAYRTLNEIRPAANNDLNRIFIKRDFPNKITIGIYGGSSKYFKDAIYMISPTNHPNSLVLQWRGTLDGKDYISVLNLNTYATAEALRDAVNNITSTYLPNNYSDKIKVFVMTVDYGEASKPSDFRPTNGTISNIVPTEISFSIEDKAWIVGNEGLILQTNNSGSKWELISNNFGFDLYDINFKRNNYGWIVGSEGSVILYDPQDLPDSFELQNTDLSLKYRGRIFPEGNIKSEAENYLDDNMIDSNVGVETTDRVQMQYAIRIVEGIDPFNFPEAGLGAEYVHSQGPNASIQDAGSYIFENMGTQNGDYGLWRARCRNTYDGWTWAIPMFIVSRRNSSPFNADTNINGSTIYNLNAIRPDGLTYEEIAESDVMDLRKKINIQSYSALLEKNFDKLLGNRLTTKIDTRDEKGTQYGTSIMLADTYVGTENLDNLIKGKITSEVVLESETKILDPSGPTPLTDDDWTIGPTLNCIYMTDEAYHVVNSYLNGAETSTIIPGYFEGLGTNKIKFNIGNYTPTTGEQYLIRVWRMNYSNDGLSRVPNIPLGIKYVPDIEDNSLFYHGINTNDNDTFIEYLEERVPGYKDYTIFYPAKVIKSTTDDQNLYQSQDIYDENSLGYRSSLKKFGGQQYRGSLVDYHYYFKATDFITKIEIPKIVNNYGILNVKKILNADTEVEYLINSDYSSNQNLWAIKVNPDESLNNTSITIFMDQFHAIPKDAVVEVILEVAPSSSVDLNINTQNAGPNLQAQKAPFVTNFNVGSKGVEGLYKSVLYKKGPLPSGTKSITIDLTGTQTDLDLKNGLITGVSSYHTKEKTYQSFVWYEPSSMPNSYYYTLPIDRIENLNSSSIVIWLDDRVNFLDGTVYVPMLVKQTAFTTATDTSKAYIFYKYCSYQTIGNLPTNLTLEIVQCSDFIYISNLGTGGSNKIKKEPYENPIEHIPVNDKNFINDNIFTNIDDLDFLNINIDTGLAKLPAYLSRYLGEDITLSLPNNVGDRIGRTFYTRCSDTFKFQTEGLVNSIPRKVFIPMIGRIRSDVVTPFVRGELVLIIFSKKFQVRTENSIGFYVDEDIEYIPGYFEEADTSIAVYRMQNYPTVRI